MIGRDVVVAVEAAYRAVLDTLEEVENAVGAAESEGCSQVAAGLRRVRDEIDVCAYRISQQNRYLDAADRFR